MKPQVGMENKQVFETTNQKKDPMVFKATFLLVEILLIFS